MSDKKCEYCNSTTTYTDKTGRAIWRKHEGKYCCSTCSMRLRDQKKKGERSDIVCEKCNSKETKQSKYGIPTWKKTESGYICWSCHISTVNSKRELSEEARRKIGEANSRRIVTEETRQKLRENVMGTRNPFYEKSHDEKSRAIMKEKRKNRKPDSEQVIQQRRVAFSGQNNPRWNNGCSPLNNTIRGHKKSIIWRFEIFKKDNFTCQSCGDASGGNLEAHHIVKSFWLLKSAGNVTTLEQALDDSEFWDIAYGVTVCSTCHDKIEEYEGYRKDEYIS